MNTESGPVPSQAPGHMGASRSAVAGVRARAIDPAELAERLPLLGPYEGFARLDRASELPWSPDGIAVWELGGLVVLAGNNLFKHAPALGRALAGAALGDGLEPILHPEAKLGMPVQA